jgi:hypothetical protein
MVLSRSEFQEWKANPGTEALFQALSEMELAVTEQMIGNVDQQALPDDYLRGYIMALRDVKSIDLEEES